jgi:hypothetical protein
VTLALVTPLLGDPARTRPGGAPLPGPSYTREYNALIARVHSERGGVLSSALDVLALANRPILADPYILSVLYSQGQWYPAPLIRRICGRQVSLEVWYNLLVDGVGEFHGYPFWPPPVVAALQETMVFETKQADRYLCVPRPTSSGATATAGSRWICPD